MESFREQSEELQERVNEIIMDSKLSVIVEGEHDILAYEVFIDEDQCHIEQFNGKENAEQVILEVNKVKPLAAIAILDRDLDTLNDKEYPQNVFLTDAHDIDTQMFLSDAFYRVAREIYTRANTSPKAKMEGIRNEIITLVRPLSYMRILSNEKGYNFAFKASNKHPKPFPYRDFLCLSRSQCSYGGDKKMITTTCRYRNQGAGMDEKEMKRNIDAIASRGYDDYIILHGHDMMSLMGLLVVRYGRAKDKEMNNEEVERAFRLTYYSYFLKSGLYQSLKSYADKLSLPFLRQIN